MDKKEAQIIILSQELRQAYHTIDFLHGCLTRENYSYAYPEQTIDRLNTIKKLINPIYTCIHSGFKDECASCQDHIKRIRERVEAEKVLGITDES